jgi:hypothetical protein
LAGLVTRLLASDRYARLEGLEVCVKLSAAGSPRGLRALQEAIRLKSGSQSYRFYRPSVRARLLEECSAARSELIERARKGILLSDPVRLGDLIAALRFLPDHDAATFETVGKDIEAVGGDSQFHGFQLAYSEQREWSVLESLRKRILAKAEILTGDLAAVDQIVTAVAADLHKFGDFYPWRMTVSDYGIDVRELPEISEVREWCREAVSRAGVFPALLQAESLQWLSFCLVEVERDPERGVVILRSREALTKLQGDLVQQAISFVRDKIVAQHEADWIISEIGHRVYGFIHG